MRRALWAVALSAMLASCTSDDGPGAGSDAGCKGKHCLDAGKPPDAAEPHDADAPDADAPDADADADAAGSDSAVSDGGDGSVDAGGDAAMPRTCSLDNGGCQDICVEADGVASCQCLHGRTLAPDQRDCHGWYDSHDFEPIYYVADELKVALDPSGRALLVWVVDARNIHFARYDGVEWGEPMALGPEFDGDVYDLQMALSGHGDAFIAWERRPSKGAGGPVFTDVVRIDLDGNVHDHLELPQGSSTIVADGLGNALLGGVRLHTAGQDGWSEPITPRPVGSELALDAAGNGLSVVREAGAIRANRYDVGASWSDPVEIAPAGAGNPRLALYGSGQGLVVWADAGGFWASHYAPDAGWSDAVFGEGGNPVSNQPLSLAVDASGNADVLWGEATDSVAAFELWTRHYDASTGWEAPVLLLDAVGDTSQFSVAVDDSGHAMFVTSGGGLYARRRTESGWQAPDLIVPSSWIFESRAISASNLGRGFLVAWIELVYIPGPLGEESRTVHVRRYD